MQFWLRTNRRSHFFASSTVAANMKTRRDLGELSALIVEHLRNSFIYNQADPWVLKESPTGGIGVFATRDIAVGEEIFKDLPILLGPRTKLTSPATCVVCYASSYLRMCVRGCGLPICSDECENSSVHLNECKTILNWRKDEKFKEWNVKVLECLTPIRSLFLNDFHKCLMRNLQYHPGKSHGFEVDILKKELNMNIRDSEENYMKFVCSVLDANAFEVVVVNGDNGESTLRGLYPLSSLLNHRCVPNTTHAFDGRQCMIVRAAVPIPKDAEIFDSYTRLIWGTVSRRYHLLRTKHFFCRCPRCMDPSEFGTNASAVLCKKCNGNVLPKDTVRNSMKWECLNCKETVSLEQVGIILSVLGSWLNDCDNGDPHKLLTHMKEKVLKVVPNSNEIALEIKYRLIWILGYKDGYSWSGITPCLCFSSPICLKINALTYLFII